MTASHDDDDDIHERQTKQTEQRRTSETERMQGRNTTKEKTNREYGLIGNDTGCDGIRRSNGKERQKNAKKRIERERAATSKGERQDTEVEAIDRRQKNTNARRREVKRV